MTADVIPFPWWRVSRSSQLPPAIDVALGHLVWLRRRYPKRTAYQIGMTYGLYVYTWAELVHGLADIWNELPEEVRREGC
jgi:hypothetical protein